LIEELHNILTTEAAKRGDGISKTAGYFQCLPPAIDFEVHNINVAEIRLQTETNLDFKIIITGLDGYNQRTLRVSCDCGYLDIHPASAENYYNISVHIPDWDDDQYVQAAQAGDMFKKQITTLIAGQIIYLNKMNKSVTKTQ
jgi:hypothetical protein